ncbi:hypothetical protein D3C72_1089360 [compost metagenome]
MACLRWEANSLGFKQNNSQALCYRGCFLDLIGCPANDLLASLCVGGDRAFSICRWFRGSQSYHTRIRIHCTNSWRRGCIGDRQVGAALGGRNRLPIHDSTSQRCLRRIHRGLRRQKWNDLSGWVQRCQTGDAVSHCAGYHVKCATDVHLAIVVWQYSPHLGVSAGRGIERVIYCTVCVEAHHSSARRISTNNSIVGNRTLASNCKTAAHKDFLFTAHRLHCNRGSPVIDRR